MKLKFSPSINIARDKDYDFNYIVTPNSTLVFNQLFQDVLIGVKTHVIIGAYGTGKSSFLLAAKQTLTAKKIHFKGFDKLTKQLPEYEFVEIVGEYSSFMEHLAIQFDITAKKYSASDVLNAIKKKYSILKKKGKGLAIVVDEFGKFLEYSANHNPEAELYFIQQLSEFVNDTNNDLLFVATLHQSFNAYATGLNKTQQHEWDKVRGRLREIVFNEPVEQLLYLASERLSQKFPNSKPGTGFEKLYETIVKSKAFPLRQQLEKEFAKRLLPFDMLSAAVLTLSLQQYGQNERSLFTFIESNDYLGINDVENNSYYNIPRVYDYLLNNYYSTLSTSKRNPHFNQWSAIRESLEKLEGVLEEKDFIAAQAIVKTIGLLNIFSSNSGKLDIKFYSEYAKLAIGIRSPEDIIAKLEKFKVIRYAKHNFRYNLLQGTDLDIELAIDNAGRIVEMVTDVSHHLNQFFDFPFISAKSESYRKGTPRFFQFKITDRPATEIPEGEVDGFINLIFAEGQNSNKEVEEISCRCKEAILYGYYKNTSEIKRLLFDIQKVQSVISQHKDDKAALKELKGVEEHYKRLLNHYVLDSLYSGNKNIIWYYGGKKIEISDRRTFNQTLSYICGQVYGYTPTIKNELINKTDVSAQISLARKRLIERLLSNGDKDNLGFNSNEFPPEKSIYLTLLKTTGIHHQNDSIWQLGRPTDKSFDELWKACTDFLESTKSNARNIQELSHILSIKPFKLKQGLIDYWLPIFLLIKNDEYCLYENDTYIPELSNSVFDLLNKKPELFKIKAFDVAGVKLELFNRYRLILNQTENHKPTNKAFIQTIRPFLVFYKELPEYCKRSSRLSKKTLAFRQVIEKAKDPEKTFFDDFPTALGYSLSELQQETKQAENFIHNLQGAIKELRSAYDELINRFESYLTKDVLSTKSEFPAYRTEIRNRFATLKSHLLLNHQKPFYNRLKSDLDDRKLWLSAIAQACIGKPLVSITDEEELVLYDKLNDLVYELDNLCEISQKTVDDEKEEILKLEVTSFVKGLNKTLLRISKQKSTAVDAKQKEVKKVLGKDKQINLVVLTKLIQELLSDE